jgi:hypothetical protein
MAPDSPSSYILAANSPLPEEVMDAEACLGTVEHKLKSQKTSLSNIETSLSTLLQ